MEKIWPKAIENNAIGYGIVVFRGEAITYAILPRDISKELPGFVGCLKEGRERFFFISAEVPAGFREPQILHEVMEIQELKEAPGSCLASLQFELTLVADDIRQEYLLYRRDFFRRLVTYCSAHPDLYCEQRIKDFQESLAYLEGLEML